NRSGAPQKASRRAAPSTMADKQSTKPPSGTRDFLPDEIRKREHVIGVIRDVYEKYGFEPLETPAFENIETLLGKYGEEGNKLIFKILKRGEHEASGQADLALRYDLTVPLARVIAHHQSDLPRLFKRYQIQPVWRADRPARGRFREFYQCDVDALGSTAPAIEAESEFERLAGFVGDDVTGVAALANLRAILALARTTPAAGRITLDPSLARGLSYYTGAIMEINVADLAGSLGGGGRYDNLVGMFLGHDVPACGFSLGLERIIVVMSEREMFPPALLSSPSDVMVTIWNEESIGDSIVLASELRSRG